MGNLRAEWPVANCLGFRLRYSRSDDSGVCQAAARLVALDGETRYVIPTAGGLAIFSEPPVFASYYTVARAGENVTVHFHRDCPDPTQAGGA